MLTKRETNAVRSVSDDFIGLYCSVIIRSLKESNYRKSVSITISPSKDSVIIVFIKEKDRQDVIDFLLQLCVKPFLPPKYIREKLVEKTSVGIDIGASHSIACYKIIFLYFDLKACELNLLSRDDSEINHFTLSFSKHKIPKNW